MRLKFSQGMAPELAFRQTNLGVEMTRVLSLDGIPPLTAESIPFWVSEVPGLKSTSITQADIDEAIDMVNSATLLLNNAVSVRDAALVNLDEAQNQNIAAQTLFNDFKNNLTMSGNFVLSDVVRDDSLESITVNSVTFPVFPRPVVYNRFRDLFSNLQLSV